MGRYRSTERRLFADAGIEPEERWIDRPNGRRIRVLAHGDGPPAVFLHGGPNAAATWAYVAGATTGVQCLLLDRPGCGLSDPPSSVPNNTDLANYVTGLTLEVLDALDIERAALVGSSFGGYSALRTAASAPERVERVALVGCPAFVPGWRAPAFFSLLRTPIVGRLVLALPASRRAVLMSLRQMGHHHSVRSDRIPEAMLDWIEAWQRDTATMANDAKMIVACGTRRQGFDPALDLRDDELATIDAPCLLLAGADDPVGGTDVVEGLGRRLRSARVESLEHAGHLPWLDDHAWVANHLIEFLTG